MHTAAAASRSSTAVRHHGLRTAAGLAGGCQPLRVHQRMRRQVIQAAHGVPGLHPRGTIAQEQHLLAGRGVFLVGRGQPGAFMAASG